MTHAALKDLLPCPFCGGEATATNYVVEAAVRCGNCGATIMRRHPPTNDEGLPEALTAWNRRAALAAMEGEAVADAIVTVDASQVSGLGSDNPRFYQTVEVLRAELRPGTKLYTAPPPQQAELAAVIKAADYFARNFTGKNSDKLRAAIADAARGAGATRCRTGGRQCPLT